MNFLARGSGRAVRLGGMTGGLSCALLGGIVTLVRAGDGPQGSPAVPAGQATRTSRLMDRFLHRASTGAESNAPSSTDVQKAAEAASVRYVGTPVPGSRITLRVEGEPDPRTTYRWVQIEGPPVAISDPTRSAIEFSVPKEAARIAFEVTKGGPGVPRTSRATVPIGTAPARDGKTPMLPQADAGDDQIALVGRRITLNGSCRTPADAVAYRWFQVDGPKVEQSSQDRSYYSFTPSTPGVYVFGLVVATCDPVTGPTISEPDDVVVTVAQMPPSNVVSPAGPVPAAIPPSTLDQAVRTARSYGDRDLLDKVAGTFESIAERATLYSSFAELSSEVMRRLDEAIPKDSNSRLLWGQGVFAPLTQYTASEMRLAGLELGSPQGLYQELNATQKEKLRVLFDRYSREFRSRSL